MSTPAATPEMNDKALWALVAAVIGLFCGLVSVLAIVLGLRAMREIEASNGTQTGLDQARIGMLLGTLGALLWAAYVGYRLFF